MLAAGQAVDRYQIEALLGEGGMAEVYRVRHRTLGSHHALKVLKLEMPGITERLVQEGQVQASLRHPNVVAVTDIIEVAGKPGLVMEYVSGPTLAQWLGTTQPTLEEAEALFMGILAGVSRAHRLGLVHRDLKPGNVLLEITDEGLVPKVADFGLAKLLAEQGGRYRTRSGVPMGTPAYMAPEQVRDAATVDQRADIFALGCILYELVCRVPPFDAPDALSIFARLARGEYTPAETLVPTLPERFRRAIRGCLMVERTERIADCAALRALFSGAADLSDTSSVHVVPIRDPAPRPTVTETLEPAGHGRSSASDTFAQEGVAGAAPTMAPTASLAASVAAPAEPSALPTRRSEPTLAAPAEPTRTSQTAPRGPGLVGWAAGLVGVGGLALGALVIAAAVALWWWRSQPTEVAPRPRPDKPDVRPPPDTIPEVPAAAPAPDAAPAAEAAPAEPAPTAAPNAAPAPGPTPADAPPAPEAAPSPPAAPPAAPAAAFTGRVTFTGDADEVWVEKAGARVAADGLDPGDYAVRARFGAEVVPAGTVRVRAGETATVNCSAAFKLCRAR